MDALNVMVVDDSSLSMKRVTQALGLLGHRVVQTARTGAEAVDHYPRVLPDLVTMDIAMPDMNGVEAVRRILQSYPDACIIMVSSHEMDMTVVEAINAGAKAYLRKPVEVGELEKAIEKIVSTASMQRARTQLCALIYGDVVKSTRVTDDRLKANLHTLLLGRLNAVKARNQVVFDQFAGDGFLICGSDVSEMAEAALDIRDFFEAVNWKQIGFAEPMTIRIALDLNKVTLKERDGKVIDVAGASIDHVARIEPVVTPNEVWCSEYFFRQMEREGTGAVQGVSLGNKELAKDYGTEELFALSRIGTSPAP